MESWVKEYIGIPYRAGGRGRNGIDCYGLVKLVLGEVFGQEAPEYHETLKASAKAMERARWFEEAAESGEWIHLGSQESGDSSQKTGVGSEEKEQRCSTTEYTDHTEKVKAGDVVLLSRGGLPIHCGVFVGESRMLHCAEGCESCVERLDDARWRLSEKRYFRLRSMA